MDGDERDDKAGGRIKLFIGSYHSYSICFFFCFYLFICVFVFFIYYRTSLISTRFSFFSLFIYLFFGGCDLEIKEKVGTWQFGMAGYWQAFWLLFVYCLLLLFMQYFKQPFFVSP